MPATSGPAHAHVRTVHVSVQFSSGQSRIPTVTAAWPGCRCLASPLMSNLGEIIPWANGLDEEDEDRVDTQLAR